jgi:hypothetical protein
MKGQYDRWLERQQKREEYKSSSQYLYEGQLDKLFGGDRYKTQPDTTRQANLKVGGSYAVVCEDNPNYYRVVFLKQNPLTGSVQSMVSNPTMGVIPANFQVTTQAQLFRFLNNNQNLQNANKAFPHFDNNKQSEYERWSNQPTQADVEAANIDRTAGLDEATKLDKVGEEDKDIDNNDKVDKTDQYLSNRRKAIAKDIENDKKVEEETGSEYRARMKAKVMPWQKPNVTKATQTPDNKAALDKRNTELTQKRSEVEKARSDKEKSMTTQQKDKRDRDNMAKAYSSPNKGALGATKSD